MKTISSVKMNTLSNKIGYLISIVCFISNISQLPVFIGVGLVKQSVMISWVLLFLYILLSSFDKLYLQHMYMLILIALFDTCIALFSVITGENYFFSNMIYPLHLCVFIFYTAQLGGQLIDEDVIYRITNSYVVSALIVGIYIYFDTFKGNDWANSIGYLYASKNSVSQIFLIAIVLLFLFIQEKKIFKWGAFVFFTFLLMLLKSRATIIGFVIFILYLIFFVIDKRRNKIVVLFILLISISIILTNGTLYNLVVNNILLNNRGSSGFTLNDISSGRIGHVEYFIDNFKRVLFFGTGGTYLESFPLAALMSYGIFASIPLFIFVISPLIICNKYKKDRKLLNWRYLIITMSIIMLLNGIFEELSPLGPGVKTYMLWLITGLYAGIQDKKKKIQNNTI